VAFSFGRVTTWGKGIEDATQVKVLKLDQRSPDWLKWRQGGVGGSDCPVIMGDVTWSTPEELARLKLGLAENIDNERMARGRKLEPRARKLYEILHDTRMDVLCVEHDLYPWLRASLDGISPDRRTVLEIKCPGDNGHKKALSGSYPYYYRAQLQQQLLVTGADRLHYWSFTDSDTFSLRDRFAKIEVLPNPEYQERLLKAIRKFLKDIGKLKEDE
jgi:putative phage-type endonuclease